jgi:thiol:disulfide interchange protein DsbD
MMKIFSVVLLFISVISFGQTPISWQVNSADLGDNTYEIKIEADLENGWHLYSQYLESDEGPLSTYITYENSNFELIGETEEIGVETHMDPVWEMDISFFSDHAIFIQKVKYLNPDSLLFKGNVNFMVCDDSQCLPPENYAFQVNLAAGSEVIEEVVYKTDSSTLAIIPELENLELDNAVNKECGDSEEENKTYWMLFLLGLGGGLISLITPCVFPMIPLTVSFFTKGGQEKGKGFAKAVLYGVSIVAVYVAISLPFYIWNLDPEILNKIASGAILNMVFFAIFMIFAFSFFGFYEIGLPSSWANKADKAADLGGFIGILFMALVLAIVSFSCTGPLLGSVLAGSLTEGPVPITIAMLGFGLGLGLPFTVFAAFPSILKSLPQSGGWLNSVKVVLGFAEVALAFKFFSTADLVEHWGVLKYEAFLAIWILMSGGIALYLFGLIKFPHDSPIVKLSKLRVGLAIGFSLITVYFGMGFQFNENTNTYQSLNLLSGLAPPVNYSWMYPIECPNGLNCYHDFDVAMEMANKNNKPVLVDFTGHSCTNCRRMEDNVWSQDKVFTLINDDYILVSLYVDDSEVLPENKQGEITINNSDGTQKQKKIKTVGDKWATFETLRFGKVSQPFYVLLSPDGKLLTNPKSYTPDVQAYADWLQCGVDAFEKLKKEGHEVEGGKQVAAENIQPIAWNLSATKLSNNEYEVVLNGAIEEGWHTYSTTLPMSDEGPLGSWITFETSDNFELIDGIIEENAHSYYDETWKMDIVDFSSEAIFKQKIKINSSESFAFKGNINFMVCKDGACLPPEDAPFEITITP